MAAYVIVDLEVTDPARFAEYRQRVPTTLAAYGGRFLVRGGEHEAAEGSRHPRREPKAMRLAASKANLVFVGGV